ncbi:MAG: hypothetical protein JXJ04_19725 [Spirochaetales bacterium]|nr:hypothetical protein [Spirochaetales bacterium]
MKLLSIITRMITIFLLILFLPFVIFADTEELTYRDYLLSILYTIPLRVTDELSPVIPEEEIQEQVIRYLRVTLKQDFETTDNREVTFPVIATTIVKRILMENMNMPSSSIPEMGSNSYYEYLDILIQLTGKTREKLSATYYFDFSRSGLEKTTRIWETIYTLQQFMRDSKFGQEAPRNSLFRPAKYNPFFLYWDEWREHKNTSYFPENHYSLKTGIFRSAEDRAFAEELIADFGGMYYKDKIKQLIEKFLEMDTHLIDGHNNFIKEEYNLAEESYLSAWNNLDEVAKIMSRVVQYKQGIVDRNQRWTPSLKNSEAFRNSLDPRNTISQAGDMWDTSWHKLDIPNGIIPQSWSFGMDLFSYLDQRYNNRKNLPVENAFQVKDLERLNTITCLGIDDAAIINDKLISLIPHLRFLLLPVCFGDLYTAQGEYTKAAASYAGCFKEQLLRASLETKTPNDIGFSNLSEADGYLPWNSLYDNTIDILNGSTYPYINTQCELLYLKIHIADLYINWAEFLYKMNKKADIARARELYKAAMKLYGRTPVYYRNLAPTIQENTSENSGTNYDLLYEADESVYDTLPDIPTDYNLNDDVYWMEESSPAISEDIPKDILTEPWNVEDEPYGIAPLSGDIIMPIAKAIFNPIINAQTGKAQIGIAQIDAGLNFYGFSPNAFSSLRYEVLIQAAKSFANLAKQAQDDYISFLEKSEQADIATMEADYAVKKAGKRVEMEAERIKQVTQELKVSSIQVQQVQDAIKAKEKEMEKAGSYWGQMKSFFKGMGSFFKAVPSSGTKAIGSDFKGAWQGGGFIGGAAGAGGFALFAVASYVTIDGMVLERNKMRKQLKTLKTRQLPLAEAAYAAKQHELAITQMQSAIAALEEDFTRELYTYLTLRVLNADTLNWMARAVKGVMKRYLDLSSMTGWLAQKALNYEQNRSVDIIRFNYFNPITQGLLAAEALQTDLALLEKEYLYGYQLRQPIKWQVSLARDFPLAFGQLLSTGTCSFMTLTDPLTTAFPGSHSHRLRTVGVSVVAPITETSYHGVLSNDGISYIIDPNQAEKKVIIRPPDAFPISAFSWEKDMALYGLPEKVLLPFEGSGIETYWTLTLPPAANPGMMDSIADVIITFETYAQFSPGTKKTITETTEGKSSHLSLFSVSQLNEETFNDFKTNLDNTIRFDITDSHFPPTKNAYEVENVFILFIGDNPQIEGTLWNASLSSPVNFTTEDGLAFSNTIDPSDPAADGITPSPLNSLTGSEPRTRWAITIDPGANPDMEREMVEDMIFGVEYREVP